MKLNLWQILGILLVIVAAVMIYRRETAPSAPTPPSVPATTVAP